MAFALATLARPALPDYMRGRVGWLELIVTGVVLGALYLINSWDFPTYLLLFIGALLLRYARAAGIGAAIAWRRYAFQALMVAVAALVLFLPFHLTFRSLVGGKEPLINLPVLGTLSRTISLVGWPKTGLHTFLIIFGLFFLPSLIWVGSQALRGRTWDSPWLVSLVALVLATAIGFPLAALVPLAFYVLRAALRCARSQDVGAVGVSFALAAFGLACLIAVGTEVIFIRDIFGNRMNTIFKFYYQIWLILGVLAGYGLWALFAGVQAPVDAEAEDVSIQPYPLGLRAAALVLFVPLLAGALVYPAQTLSHLYSEGKASGLNGTNPRERDPNGAAAIAWLRQNARGDAVIVEAVDTNRDYGYDTAGLGISGVSSSTGLATVIGWTTHQTQWRGGDPATFAQIYPRWEDVRTIYTTLDVGQARTLLEKYGVRYIYVGGTERATYPPDALTKFDQIGTPVFQQGDVTIYQIGS
jgi:YYY domain-containing protein